MHYFLNRVLQQTHNSRVIREALMLKGFLSLLEIVCPHIGVEVGEVIGHGPKLAVVQFVDWRDGSPNLGLAVFSIEVNPILSEGGFEKLRRVVLEAAEGYEEGVQCH